MRVARLMGLVALLSALPVLARAQESDAAQNRAKLEEAKRAIASMRESYAYVIRKENTAKTEHDPVLLNTLHQIANRISDLVSVADHALDDMRVAITSNEPEDAIDAELEKITLAKTKVEQARAEADRSVGIKMLSSGEGEDLSRTLAVEDQALAQGSGTTDPMSGLANPQTIPVTNSIPPPASRSQ